MVRRRQRRLWLGAGPLLATVLGGILGGACASSDAVVEQRMREQALRDASQTCYPGARERCYGGPAETAGRGACEYGERVCEGGTWGGCQGAQLPAPERCNRRDDDCDGIVDNGFERDGALCFFEGARGACRTQGVWRCAADGTDATCDAPVVEPTPERCDGIDNDCDGRIDEDAVPPRDLVCDTGQPGVCGPGKQRCVEARLRCVQDVQPGPEICNGLDDDCDGRVDDDCVRTG